MLPAAVTYEFKRPQVLRAFRICWREGRYDPDRGVNAGPVRYRVHVRRPDGKAHCLYDKPWAREMEPDLRRVAAEVNAIPLDMYTPLLPFVETAHFVKDGIHPEGGAQTVIAEITANAVLQLR